jgi:hypothetical protein
MSTTPKASDEQESSKEEVRENEGNRLIKFAESICVPLKGTDGRHCIAFKATPHLAVSHSSASSDAMHEICNIYFAQKARWPNSAARQTCADYLTAQCKASVAQEVNLRVGMSNGTIYLDTAWANNSVIRIDSTGFKVVDTCPAMFTRSHVTGPLLKISEAPLALRELLKFIRVPKEALPVLVGCLVSGWISNIPQPIVFLQGAAKSGKTTSLRFLMDIFDPSTQYPGTSMTNNPRELKSMASMRRTFVFDNVSYIDNDESDLLARISTGGEITSRSLYTNDEAHVTQMMRPIYINGIMQGFTRSDLASRSVVFLLDPFDSTNITAHSELNENWQEAKSAIFTELLRVTGMVLKELETRPKAIETNHRNVDLVGIIAVVSDILGIDGLPYLENSVIELSDVVLGSSVLGGAMQSLANCIEENPTNCNHQYSWNESGKAEARAIVGRDFEAAELLELIKSHTLTENWKDIPNTPKKLGEGLKRIEADLLTLHGLAVVKKRTKKCTVYQLAEVVA